MEKVVSIPLNQIAPFPGNRRVGGFDQARLEQLAESIRAVGVQQPAVVRRRTCAYAPDEAVDRVCRECRCTDDRACVDEELGPCWWVEPDLCSSCSMDEPVYELVAGERRWRASRIAELDVLPCVVRDLDDLEVLTIQTVENLQREDVHPLDEADGYRRLMEQAGLSAEQVAEAVGQTKSYIYHRLKLCELGEAGRQALVEGEISAGHAELVARLPAVHQERALELCTDEVWDSTSRETILLPMAHVREIVTRAFRGFNALPAPDWRGILGLDGTVDRQTVERAYRERIRRAHPDAGGSHEEAVRITEAYRQALQEVGT